MKWIGQHIWDFISRFRSDVYLEELSLSSDTDVLVVNSDGKISKNSSAFGGTTSITVEDVSDAGYEMICTVQGGTVETDAFGAGVNMSLRGHASGTVVAVNFEILVSHSQDITISSMSNDATEAILRIKSDSNDNFSIEVKTNNANLSNLLCTISPQSNEVITPNPNGADPGYSGASLEYTATEGYKLSGEDGGTGKVQALFDNMNVVSAHASYDFYNDGTTYLNGSTTIDDTLDVVGAVTIDGDLIITSGNKITSTADLDFVIDSNNNGSNSYNFLFDGSSTVASLTESGNFEIKGSTNGAPSLKLTQTEHIGTTGVPFIVFDRAEILNDDYDIGFLNWQSENYSGGSQIYSQIVGTTEDISTFTTGGSLEFRVASNDGELVTGLKVKDGSEEDEVDIILGNGSGSTISYDGELRGYLPWVLNCGFNGASSNMYMPFANGGTLEYTSVAGRLENIGIVAPADGFVKSVTMRSEYSCGDSVVKVHTAGVGVEVPSLTGGSFLGPTIDMDTANKGYTFTGFEGYGGSLPTFNEGDVITISFDPTSITGDTVSSAVLMLNWES